MQAWQQLNEPIFGPIHNQLWDRFENQFQFNVRSETGIQEPIPSVTYSIESLYNSDWNTELANIQDLNRKFLSAFRLCCEPSKKLAVLDWQHEAFWFYPHEQINPDDLEEFKIAFFPAGDYYIFLSQNFDFGTFGHPWQNTICVFGEPLIQAVQSDLPTCFKEIRRQT